MVWLTRLESTLRRYGRKRSRSSTACDGAVPAVDGSSGMLRCALQMVSSETIMAGHPMQAAPPPRCRVATSPMSPPMSAQPQTSQGPNLGLTVPTFENPMGLDGLEFVEFAAPEGQGEAMHDYFGRLGLTAAVRRQHWPITIYSQGGVHFLLNVDTDSFATDYIRSAA